MDHDAAGRAGGVVGRRRAGEHGGRRRANRGRPRRPACVAAAASERPNSGRERAAIRALSRWGLAGPIELADSRAVSGGALSASCGSRGRSRTWPGPVRSERASRGGGPVPVAGRPAAAPRGELTCRRWTAADGRPEAWPVGRRLGTGRQEREAWAVLAVAGLGPVGFGALSRFDGRRRDRAMRPRRAGARSSAAGVNEGREHVRRTHRREAIAEVVGVDPGSALGSLARRRHDPDARRVGLPGRGSARSRCRPRPLRQRRPHALSAPHAVASSGLAGRPSAAGSSLARIGAAIASDPARSSSRASRSASTVRPRPAVTAEGGTPSRVLGSGHGRLYPRAHRDLATSIVATRRRDRLRVLCLTRTPPRARSPAATG